MPRIAAERMRAITRRFGSSCDEAASCARPRQRRSGGGGGNRTRVRKPYTVRTTCLAWLFELRLAPANRQADARLAASTDPAGQAARPAGEADVNDAAPPFGGLAHQQAS